MSSEEVTRIRSRLDACGERPSASERTTSRRTTVAAVATALASRASAVRSGSGDVERVSGWCARSCWSLHSASKRIHRRTSSWLMVLRPFGRVLYVYESEYWTCCFAWSLQSAWRLALPNECLERVEDSSVRIICCSPRDQVGISLSSQATRRLCRLPCLDAFARSHPPRCRAKRSPRATSTQLSFRSSSHSLSDTITSTEVTVLCFPSYNPNLPLPYCY